MNALFKNPVVGGAIVLGVLWLIYGNKLKQDAAAVGNAVNPASQTNIVNRGVTSVGVQLSGDPNWTLGGWIYDLTHPAYDPNAPAPPADPNSYDTQAISQANQ